MEIDFDYLHSLGDGHKIAVYDAEAGDKIRIIAPYIDKYYIIFWLQVLKDGSVYCSVRKPNMTKYGTGTIIPTEKGVTLNFENEQLMKEIIHYDKMRMSFHGSGIIHSPEYGEVTTRKPIRELISQEELVVAIFEEPSKYDSVTSVRKKDLCILSEILPNHPIFLQAFIAPADKMQIVKYNEGNYQYTAILEYHNIDGIGDMNIQLCFCFDSEAQYPPYSYIVWSSTK